MRLKSDDWSRKIPVEAKVLLMQLLNIESKVSKGDLYNYTSSSAMLNQTNNLNENFSSINEKFFNNVETKNFSLRDLFEKKPNLNGHRTEVKNINIFINN